MITRPVPEDLHDAVTRFLFAASAVRDLDLGRPGQSEYDEARVALLTALGPCPAQQVMDQAAVDAVPSAGPVAEPMPGTLTPRQGPSPLFPEVYRWPSGEVRVLLGVMPSGDVAYLYAKSLVLLHTWFPYGTETNTRAIACLERPEVWERLLEGAERLTLEQVMGGGR